MHRTVSRTEDRTSGSARRSARKNAGRWPPCTSAHLQRLAPATIFQPPVLILGYSKTRNYEVCYGWNVCCFTEGRGSWSSVFLSDQSPAPASQIRARSEEHTSELQSRRDL